MAETDTGTVSIHLGTVEGRVQGDSLLPQHSLLLYLEIEQTRFSAHETWYIFTTNSPNVSNIQQTLTDKKEVIILSLFSYEKLMT